jgi:parvulin-like peptidyl-prolyl isomerase
MKNKLLVFFFCVAFLAVGCKKNGFEGEVKIFNSDKAVPGVKVQAVTNTDIKEEQSKSTRFGTSDKTGHYKISGLLPNRKYRITSVDHRYVSDSVVEIAPEKGTRIISDPIIACPSPQTDGIWFYNTADNKFEQIDITDAPKLLPRVHAGLLPGMWSRNNAYSISENDALKVSTTIPHSGLIILKGRAAEDIARLYHINRMIIQNRAIEGGWYFNISGFYFDRMLGITPTIHELNLGGTFKQNGILAVPVENLAEGLYFFTTRFVVLQKSALRGNVNKPQEGFLIRVGGAKPTSASGIPAKVSEIKTVGTPSHQQIEPNPNLAHDNTISQVDRQSPAFNLAMKLSATIPTLAPDMEIILADTKGFKITALDVISSLYNNLGTRASQLTAMGASQLKQIIMNEARSLGERKLMVEAAQSANLAVTDEEIDKVLQNEYSRSGGEANFINSLQAGGVSFDYLRNYTKETVLINKYLAQTIKASVNEDPAFAQTATVRHILLLTQGKTEAEKEVIKNELEGILIRAKSGEDFAALAKTYSEDPGSKDKGGLYENIKRGQMYKSFEEAAFSIPVGEIGEIVETQYGYHIIQVVSRTAASGAGTVVRPSEKQSPRVPLASLDELKDRAGFRLYPERLDR